MSTFLPEIYKYWCSEMKPKKLIATSITIGIICFTILLAALNKGDIKSVERVISGFVVIQFLILSVYGAAAVGNSISQERTQSTWDFQRLTPLSSHRIIFGKLIGALSYPAYCSANIFIWACLGWLLAPAKPEGFWYYQFFLLMSSLSACAGAIFISSLSNISRSAGMTAVGSGILGFMIFSSAVRPYIDNNDSQIYLMGLFVPTSLLLLINNFTIAIWAAWGAIWHIGEELLEPRKIWRFPGFLFFLVLLSALNFSSDDTRLVSTRFLPSIAIILCLVLVFASIINSSGYDQIKMWLRKDSTFKQRLNNTPLWISGWIAVLFCLILSTVIGYSNDITTNMLPITLLFFVGRDLAFLQLVRLSASKRPDLTAFIFIGLSYFVPWILFMIVRIELIVTIASPFAIDEKGTSLISAVLQFFVMYGILIARVKSRLSTSAAITA